MGVNPAKEEETTEQATTLQDAGGYQDFLGLQTAVHPTGDDAQFIIHTRTGEVRLSVPFSHIGMAESEIRYASRTMMYRQAMKIDEGNAALKELVDTAMRPAAISALVDQTSGDRIFVMQFSDHAPIVIRMTMEEVGRSIDEMMAAVQKSAN